MSRPAELTREHLIAFIYVYFAHATDGFLAQAEYDEIVARITKRAPEIPPAEVKKRVRESAEWYQGITETKQQKKVAWSCLTVLKNKFPHTDLLITLIDLEAIATADGLVAPEEINFLRAFAEHFEIQYDLSALEQFNRLAGIEEDYDGELIIEDTEESAGIEEALQDGQHPAGLRTSSAGASQEDPATGTSQKDSVTDVSQEDPFAEAYIPPSMKPATTPRPSAGSTPASVRRSKRK